MTNESSENQKKKFMRECLERMGKAPACADCFLSEDEDLCRELAKTIQKMEKKLSHMEKSAAEDILSRTLEAIWRGLDSFQSQSRFSTWAFGIFKNKRRDYFRSLARNREIPISGLSMDGLDGADGSEGERMMVEEKLSLLQFDFDEMQGSVEGETITWIVEVLEGNLATDPTGCARLFLDLWHAWQHGNELQDVALDYGLKPNTLTKRKQRCQATIQEMLEEDHAAAR